MEVMRGVAAGFHTCKPYLFLILNRLCVSIFMILIESLASSGISILVIVVYEHLLGIVFLAFLTFVFEKNERPPLTSKTICYAFLLGFLQVCMAQMLLTMSLEFVSATYQSIALNLIPAITFVMALICKQETLVFKSKNGQAKIWGLAISFAGALILILWKGPVVVKAVLRSISDVEIGYIMLVVGLFGTSLYSILMRHVNGIYQADITLSTLMTVFGTLQASIMTAFIVSSSSWKLPWDGGLVLITLLLGATGVTGLAYVVTTWAIRTRGAVFAVSFYPLLIVFSFLLETFVLGSSTHLGSIIGAVLVPAGLYFILWAKANDGKQDTGLSDSIDNTPLIQPSETSQP